MSLKHLTYTELLAYQDQLIETRRTYADEVNPGARFLIRAINDVEREINWREAQKQGKTPIPFISVSVNCACFII